MVQCQLVFQAVRKVTTRLTPVESLKNALMKHGAVNGSAFNNYTSHPTVVLRVQHEQRVLLLHPKFSDGAEVCAVDINRRRTGMGASTRTINYR